MKHLLYFFVLICLFACKKETPNNIKSLEDYRTEAATADRIALELDKQKEALLDELEAVDTIYRYGGPMTADSAEVTAITHLIDSIDALLQVQLDIMRRCEIECDSIYGTYAL